MEPRGVRLFLRQLARLGAIKWRRIFLAAKKSGVGEDRDLGADARECFYSRINEEWGRKDDSERRCARSRSKVLAPRGGGGGVYGGWGAGSSHLIPRYRRLARLFKDFLTMIVAQLRPGSRATSRSKHNCDAEGAAIIGATARRLQNITNPRPCRRGWNPSGIHARANFDCVAALACCGRRGD